MRAFIVIFCIFLVSCVDLDLDPASQPATGSWYQTPEQIEMSLNDLYRHYVWALEDRFETDRWTDDWAQRQVAYPYVVGAITSEWGHAVNNWTNTYKGISRANRAVENVRKLAGEFPQEILDQLEAEARFFRANFYTRLITLWGDVPFFLETISIDEAFELGRVDREVVLEQVYEDFDFAIDHLPVDNSGSGITRADKGAALAMKARAALWLSDWEMVKESAKACMELGEYSLYPDYLEYFTLNTKVDETIFALPRSYELDFYQGTRGFILRTAGGTADAQPSWELLASYLCTDGLPINESPLFDPGNPFRNRDPRCTATFIEHGTEHLGYIYDPHPSALQVLNVETGQMVTNVDTKANSPWAAFNCMMLRKWQTEEWKLTRSWSGPLIIMRYADVLLMYAEAKIELNEIDQSAIDAINKVRARAYGVDISATGEYPAVSMAGQDELKRALRLERRAEFAWENRRFWDLHRWRMFEEVFAHDYYGHHAITELRERIIEPDLWFWPYTPHIDEHGIADFRPMFEEGLIARHVQRNFDPKQYLWPIPHTDVVINENIDQNPGY